MVIMALSDNLAQQLANTPVFKEIAKFSTASPVSKVPGSYLEAMSSSPSYGRKIDYELLSKELADPQNSALLKVLAKSSQATVASLPQESQFIQQVVPVLQQIQTQIKLLHPKGRPLPSGSYKLNQNLQQIGARMVRNVGEITDTKTVDDAVLSLVANGKLKEAAEAIYDQMYNLAVLTPYETIDIYRKGVVDGITPSEFWDIMGLRSSEASSMANIPTYGITTGNAIGSKQAGPSLDELNSLISIAGLTVDQTTGKIVPNDALLQALFGNQINMRGDVAPGIASVLNNADFINLGVPGLAAKTWPYRGAIAEKEIMTPSGLIIPKEIQPDYSYIADSQDAASRLGATSATTPRSYAAAKDAKPERVAAQAARSALNSTIAQLPGRYLSEALGLPANAVMQINWPVGRIVRGSKFSSAPMTYLNTDLGRSNFFNTISMLSPEAQELAKQPEAVARLADRNSKVAPNLRKFRSQGDYGLASKDVSQVASAEEKRMAQDIVNNPILQEQYSLDAAMQGKVVARTDVAKNLITPAARNYPGYVEFNRDILNKVHPNAALKALQFIAGTAGTLGGARLLSSLSEDGQGTDPEYEALSRMLSPLPAYNGGLRR